MDAEPFIVVQFQFRAPEASWVVEVRLITGSSLPWSRTFACVPSQNGLFWE